MAEEDERFLYSAVWLLRQVQQREGIRPSDIKAEYGVTSSEQWQTLQGIREDLRSDLRVIGDRARAEL